MQGSVRNLLPSSRCQAVVELEGSDGPKGGLGLGKDWGLDVRKRRALLRKCPGIQFSCGLFLKV